MSISIRGLSLRFLKSSSLKRQITDTEFFCSGQHIVRSGTATLNRGNLICNDRDEKQNLLCRSENLQMQTIVEKTN